MPRIDLITPVYYQPNDPYHYEIDNLPLRKIVERQELINLALDNVIEQMRDAIGTQGSVANRLNQSINADGSLKAAAIDEALHSIEEHSDTDNYVRMTKNQSDKLDGVAENATDLKVQINSNLFDSGVVIFKSSSTVTAHLNTPNIVQFHMAFPKEAAHRHYFGITAVHDDLIDPDYIHYKVNSNATPYMEGSLRVYVNGARVFHDVSTYVPGVNVNDPWVLLNYTPDHENGTFEFSTALTEDDVIKTDFDISLASNDAPGPGQEVSNRYVGTFDDADLNSGILVIEHNLGANPVFVAVYDENNEIVSPDEVKLLDSNSVEVDLSGSSPISGTWSFIVIG